MMRTLLNLIEKIRRTENSIPKRVKCFYKRKKFSKYAKVGENLNICSRANCSAEIPGSIQIGNNCRVYGTLRTQGEGRISLGNHTCIYECSIVGSVENISIGDCVIISNNVHIYDNNNHPVSPALRRKMCMEGFEGDPWRWVYAKSAPIIIEDNVWIGEYAAILKGVRIGRGSIVASHAVVTKDVPPYTIVAGNPARVVKTIENDEE